MFRRGFPYLLDRGESFDAPFRKTQVKYAYHGFRRADVCQWIRDEDVTTHRRANPKSR